MATATSAIETFDTPAISLPASAGVLGVCETDQATLLQPDGSTVMAKVVSQHQQGISVLVATQRSIPVGQPMSIRFGSHRLPGHAVQTRPWGAAQRIELLWG